MSASLPDSPVLAQWLHEAALRLTRPSIPEARRDIEVLAGHALALDRGALLCAGTRCLTREERCLLDQLCERRAHGEPVAYLTGTREFWSLPLRVTPDVLIPRPETEHLVEAVLDLVPRGTPARIADLGTGSGAIALALAVERPEFDIVATDASATAIAVARDNATRLGLINRIGFRVNPRPGDWFEHLAGENFDIIVANPPYIAAHDPHLAQGDVRFEPRAALASGESGLDALLAIIAGARAHLGQRHPGSGWLVLEHGYDQQAALCDRLAAQGYRDIRTGNDLAGLARFVVACHG